MKWFSKIEIIILAVLFIFVFFPHRAHADALTALSDTMTRLKKTATPDIFSDHTIRFTTPSGATDATDTIEITMPTGFAIGSVDYTDIDLHWGAGTGLENSATLAAAADATHWGAYFTGQILSFDHATDGAFEDIPTTNKIVVEIGTNATGGGANLQIENHATAATYTISIGGDFGDTGKMAIVILDDDQVQLTATVNPSITFTLSANSSDYGTLLTGSVIDSSPDITLTIGTNAGSGYTVTVRDTGSGSNPGLYNSGVSYLIGSTDAAYNDGPTTLVAGTEGMGLYVSGTTGSPTVAARYNGGTGSQVGGLEITDTTIISRITSMSANDTATIRHKAAISTFTAAGSYSDTLTYIATGNF